MNNYTIEVKKNGENLAETTVSMPSFIEDEYATIFAYTELIKTTLESQPDLIEYVARELCKLKETMK